jgi:hypothetical protein
MIQGIITFDSHRGAGTACSCALPLLQAVYGCSLESHARAPSRRVGKFAQISKAKCTESSSSHSAEGSPEPALVESFGCSRAWIAGTIRQGYWAQDLLTTVIIRDPRSVVSEECQRR